MLGVAPLDAAVRVEQTGQLFRHVHRFRQLHDDDALRSLGTVVKSHALVLRVVHFESTEFLVIVVLSNH